MAKKYKIINTFYRIVKYIYPLGSNAPIVLNQNDNGAYNRGWAECTLRNYAKEMLNLLNETATKRPIENIYKCGSYPFRPIFNGNDEIIICQYEPEGHRDIANIQIHHVYEAIGDDASIAYYYRNHWIQERPFHKNKDWFNLYKGDACIAVGLNRDTAFHTIDQMAVVQTSAENKNGQMRVTLNDGHLIATRVIDPEYPGIDIEFIANDDIGNIASHPRVLIEKPIDGNLRTLIWNNPASEDYTEKINMIDATT